MSDDNKELLNEIDELDDNAIKEKKRIKGHERAFSIFMIIIIIIALIILYIFYKGKYIINESDNKQEDYDSYYDGFSLFETYNDEEDTEEVDYETLQSIEEEKFLSQQPNIVITNEKRDIYNDMLLTLTNNNDDEIFDLDFYIVFYDEQNKIIQIESAYIDILNANSDYYVTIFNVPETYARYDYLLSKTNYILSYTTYNDEVTYDVTDDGEKIKIKGKNNSEVELDNIEFLIIYYNDLDEIVYVEELEEIYVDSGDKFEITQYHLVDEESYSRYEVVFLDAYATLY